MENSKRCPIKYQETLVQDENAQSLRMVMVGKY